MRYRCNPHDGSVQIKKVIFDSLVLMSLLLRSVYQSSPWSVLNLFGSKDIGGMASTLYKKKSLQAKATPKQISQPVDAGLGGTHEDYEKVVGTVVNADDEENLVDAPE